MMVASAVFVTVGYQNFTHSTYIFVQYIIRSLLKVSTSVCPPGCCIFPSSKSTQTCNSFLATPGVLMLTRQPRQKLAAMQGIHSTSVPLESRPPAQKWHGRLPSSILRILCRVEYSCHQNNLSAWTDWGCWKQLVPVVGLCERTTIKNGPGNTRHFQNHGADIQTRRRVNVEFGIFLKSVFSKNFEIKTYSN